MDIAPEGQVYCQRYHVGDFPHIGIIDPRTRRLMWKKEGWTQENPMSAELFAETAMDFCSRHSFDKPPQAPRPPNGASRPSKRPMHEMTEDEQLQAAMQASLKQATGEDDNDDGDGYEVEMDDDDIEDDEVEYVGSNADAEDKKQPAEETAAKKEPTLLEQLLAMEIDEPEKGARIQFRMPDGKRKIRKFDANNTVKAVYAFVAVSFNSSPPARLCAGQFSFCFLVKIISNTSLYLGTQQSIDECKEGKEFVLMAGFPPKDLADDMENSIDSCKLSGQAITVRWK